MAFRRVFMAATALVFAAGCSEPAPPMREVTISGSASLPDGTNPPGTLHVQAYLAWTGEGELRHPLGELGGFTGQSAGFSGTISVPAGGGEGLVVHAWLDADGDGVHCTPANRSEPAGIAVVEAIPEGEARVSIALTENCAAANWFFPPKAAAP